MAIYPHDAEAFQQQQRQEKAHDLFQKWQPQAERSLKESSRFETSYMDDERLANMVFELFQTEFEMMGWEVKLTHSDYKRPFIVIAAPKLKKQQKPPRTRVDLAVGMLLFGFGLNQLFQFLLHLWHGR